MNRYLNKPILTSFLTVFVSILQGHEGAQPQEGERCTPPFFSVATISDQNTENHNDKKPADAIEAGKQTLLIKDMAFGDKASSFGSSHRSSLTSEDGEEKIGTPLQTTENTAENRVFHLPIQEEHAPLVRKNGGILNRNPG